MKAAAAAAPTVFGSVWDALEATPELAAHMQLRSDLMIQLSERIKNQGWTQAEAAARCGLTQPRVNELLRGRIDRFSLDALVKIASALGLRLQVQLMAA